MTQGYSQHGADGTCGGLLPLIPGLEDSPALWDDGEAHWWSRSELRHQALELADKLGYGRKKLIFLEAASRAASVVALFGVAAAGHAVARIDPLLATDKKQALEQRYRPDFVVQVQAGSEPIVVRDMPAVGDLGADDIHRELLLLLSTSGTTGSAKFVRLSAHAVAINAKQIAATLGIDADSTAIAHLPMHYSYGLSVITSHLLVGGRVAVIDDSVTSPSFWAKVSAANGTHFPGVPFHYTTLARLGFPLVPPSVTTFTQAGGALNQGFQKLIYEKVSERRARFFVMYGQTEAAPRMTTLPSELWASKPGSVGPAMPDSVLTILDEKGESVADPEAVGVILYQGPNVMMGYAEMRADLALGDTMGGRLETGDLGRLDADGCLYLVGRVKRFAKIAGLRLGLDDVEREIGTVLLVSCLDAGDKIAVCHEGIAPETLKPRLRAISTEYKIPPSSFSVHQVVTIPRKASGKVDYARLGDAIRVRTPS